MSLLRIKSLKEEYEQTLSELDRIDLEQFYNKNENPRYNEDKILIKSQIELVTQMINDLGGLLRNE